VVESVYSAVRTDYLYKAALLLAVKMLANIWSTAVSTVRDVTKQIKNLINFILAF